MSSIFEKIALKVISYYLDNYINPIQGSQIKLALTTGNAELNNVSIKSTALSTHHLPFTVTSGLIQSIKLHFPWHSLKKRPCIIDIEGIHIIANFSKSVKLKSELEIKESVLKELEDAGLGDEKIKNALFQGTISQIISNIIINIKNIHIRVEINTPDPKTHFAIGLMCDRIELFSISENGKQTFVQPDANIAKRIEIHDFSIYADPQPDNLDLPTTQEKVEEYLKMRYKEKHEYILDSFSFSSDYIITKHQLQTCSNMDNLIEKICFKLTQKQMAVFGEYLYQYNLFQLRKRYSLCGRPENPSINDDDDNKLMFKWWRFVHQCTIEKRYPNRINIQESILILKTRTSYYDIWKIRRSMSTKDFKKNSNYKILKKIEDRLPLNSILFLRNYSDYRINKEKEDKFVLDESDLNMLTNSNTLENSADISLLIKSIKVKIYESQQSDEKPILTFAAHELNNKFIHSFDKSSSFSLICKLLKIYSREKIIFQQDSANRSSVELKYTVTPNTKEKHVNIIASDPFINVDLKFLYNLKVMLIDNGFKKCPSSSYFSFTKKIAEIVEEESNKYTPYMIRKGQYADMILQKKCDDYPYIKMKMKLLTPTVQIQGAKLSFKMKEINFESFPIHDRFANKVETLYSNYLLKCTDFSIGLEKYEILKPVTIDFNLDLIITPVEWLDKFRIALNISSIAVIFNKETYREIVDGCAKLMKLSQEYEQAQTEKVIPPKTENLKNNYIENVNMENLSTNYATKVSVLFNNISLELVTVGRFDIVNFETQITVGSNGLGLNLRIQNIICNSLENKYIFFDVNEINPENHFLKENNAIVCKYTLFFDRAMKFNMSVNSPTIIVDFGWLESTLDFFKSADIKKLLMYKSQKPIKNETDIDIMESVMTNSIEFQLLKPTFKVILPALNKCKDDVELTLVLEYISFGQIESQQSDEKPNMLLKMPTFSFEWKKRLTATINNFSILLGNSFSLFFDDLVIFDIVEDKKNIEIKPLKQNEGLTNPFLTMKRSDNKVDTTINDFSITFNVNSYMIPELILSLLKSTIIANIISSFMNETNITTKTEKEEEKPNLSTYIINMPNGNIKLIDNDVKLNSNFNAMFTVSPSIKHLFFKSLSLSFSEKEFDFAPIFENVAFEFGIKESTLIFIMDKANVYISPSDIIDIMNFIHKILNLYSNFSHQLDYSKPAANVDQSNESKSIKNLSIANHQIVLEFCEDNRTTKIPYPFLRLSIDQNSTNVSLIKSPCFLLLSFQVDIFNKNTQRWDLLIEPLKIFLSFTDTKHFNFEIEHKLNIIISHSILNQICQFQFERQSINHDDILPCFFIENNTREVCELVFDDPNDNISIPPQCLSGLRKNKSFKFLGKTIDPLNFYSPQFISDKYSFAIFIKGKERYISINSPLLFKNKSNFNLFYQERHSNDVVELLKKSITPLYKLTAEFGIYGKNPKETPNVINLFNLKEKKKLFIPVFVEDKTYYYFLSIKFSKKRGIVMITLTPHYQIRNNYNLPIIFTIIETSQTIKIPGKSTEYLDHAGFDSSFDFCIEANKHVSQPTKLNLTNNTFIPVNFSPNSAFSLRYNNDMITLQPPLLVKNLTDIPVTIFDFQNNQIITLLGKSSEDFIGPMDFFKENKIQLSIQLEGYEKSELFVTTIGRKEMFLKSLSCNHSIPIALLLSIEATSVIYLKIDLLVYIRNESNEKIHLQPIDETINPLDIDPGQTKPVLLGNSELNFIFSIENNKESFQINLQNTLENRNQFATLFINQFSLHNDRQFILSVDFQTSSSLPGYLVVIKNCVFPQPLVLTNLLGEKNELKQVDVVVNCGFNSQRIVKPMSTSIISSRDLVGQKLKVSCYNQDFEVDLTKFTEPTIKTIQIGEMKIEVYFKLVCLENGSHMIIISNEIENKPNRFNLFSTHEISFGLKIPFTSVNLIDDHMKELSLIGFQNASIKCEFTKDTVEINLQIDLFQIDDMYPDTIVPVAVFNSIRPFISLKMIKENANMIFDLIELKLKPLTFYIDINYIAELFNFIRTIKMKKKDETDEAKFSSNQSSIPILIKEMYIDKVEIYASASSQTGRPTFHPFPYEFIMDYVPSVSNIYLGRTAFIKSDLSSDNKVLKKMLKDYYDPLVTDIKGLVAANSISFVFRSISNAFHKMGDTTKIDVAFNQERGKVIERGFESLGRGLLNGVAGVVTKPIKGLEEDGAKGFFIGLGKGVGGIITDPVAGIIDAGAGIVDEVKNSMSEFRDPMRFPRVFNNIQIQKYNRVGAICQLQYQRLVKNYEDRFVYFINGKEKFLGITESSIVFLVQNAEKTDASNEYKVDKLRLISDVKNVCSFENFLILKFIDESGYDIECQSHEIADIATKIIVSRSYYCNYICNSSNMTKIASTDFSSNESILPEIEQQTIIIKDGFYSIKSTNGKYVSNENESMALIANRENAKGWEKFKITNNDDGTISFFSVKNNKYVTVGSKSKLLATESKISRNEKFSVTKISDNCFNFISMKTRQYISADRNKLAKLYANRLEAKTWEKFELIPRD